MYATGEGGLAVIEQEQGDSVASPIARCLSISAPALALLAAHVGGSAAIVVGGLFFVGLMILGFFTPRVAAILRARWRSISLSAHPQAVLASHPLR